MSIVKGFAIACVALVTIWARAEPEALTSYRGTYRGLSFSRVGVGEYEVVIDHEFFNARLATGRRVLTLKIPTGHFRAIPPDHMTPEMASEPGRFAAFGAPQGYPQLYFTLDPHVDPEDTGKTDFALFVFNEPAAEAVGPTVLLGSSPGEVVACEEFLEAFDGDLPRLPR